MKSLSALFVPLVALSLACNGSGSSTEAPAAAGPVPATAPAEAPNPEAERHYQMALELEVAGRYDEAQAEVELAIEGGAGRDAKLLAAKLAILRNDLDTASRLLEPLSKDPNDAPVLYNLGLIAQKRGRYNSARSRYLAALKADPEYRAARFNLALLTWNAGVKEEAQHHARKYIDAAPNDPHALQLQQLIFSPAAGDPAGATVTPGAVAPATGATAAVPAGAVTPGAVAPATGGVTAAVPAGAVAPATGEATAPTTIARTPGGTVPTARKRGE